MTDEILTGLLANDDEKIEENLRPKTFVEFIGQSAVKEKLKVYVKAAAMRKTQLDHVLLYGPPGIGKTTLAQIISNELGAGFYSTSGPVIEKKVDIASIITGLAPNSCLFIDEIHRLNTAIEEIMYSAMEDFKIDIMVGQGPSAESVKISTENFTLIGATTKSGSVSAPLRSRFGIVERLDYYDDNEIIKILKRSAQILKIKYDDEGIKQIALRSRGTPRIANRLLKRVSDYAIVGGEEITLKVALSALERLGIDAEGLDAIDRKILNIICRDFNGGPVGLKTIAASLSEEPLTIEELNEPYLIRKGFIKRTPQGREASQKAYEHLKIKKKSGLF